MKIKWTRIHFLGDVFRCCRLPRILRSLIKQQRRRRLQRRLFACKGEFALLRSFILRDCIEIQEKKIVVLYLRPPQNVKLGSFHRSRATAEKKLAPGRETFTAARNKEKRLFSQAKKKCTKKTWCVLFC